MKTQSLMLLSAALFAAGCVTESAIPTAVLGDAELLSAKGQTTYAYSVSGDIASTPGAIVPTARARTGSPFTNVSVENVTLTLGTPTGNISACQTGSGTYDTTFGGHGGLTVNGKLSFYNTGTVSFLGVRVGGGETIQFSTADASGGGVVTAGPGGSYTLTFTDARLFFDSNSAYYDGLYRCVNLAFTATP